MAVDRSTLDIVLLTETANNSSGNAVIAMLTNGGFTAGNITEIETGDPIPACDVLIVIRAIRDTTEWAPVNTVWQAGTPVLLGTNIGVGTGTSGTNALSTFANITGTCYVTTSGNGVNDIVITDNTHYITENFALGTLNLDSSGNIIRVVDSGESYVGTLLATGDADYVNTAGRPAFIVVNQGTTLLNSAGTAPARAVFHGSMAHFFGSTGTNAEDLICRSVDWLYEGDVTAGVSGSVTESMAVGEPTASGTKGNLVAPPSAIDSVLATVTATAVVAMFGAASFSVAAQNSATVETARSDSAAAITAAENVVSDFQTARFQSATVSNASSVAAYGGGVVEIDGAATDSTVATLNVSVKPAKSNSLAVMAAENVFFDGYKGVLRDIDVTTVVTGPVPVVTTNRDNTAYLQTVPQVTVIGDGVEIEDGAVTFSTGSNVVADGYKGLADTINISTVFRTTIVSDGIEIVSDSAVISTATAVTATVKGAKHNSVAISEGGIVYSTGSGYNLFDARRVHRFTATIGDIEIIVGL